MSSRTPVADYRCVQVDVFTNHIFGGNPLAVFFDAGELSSREMQSIAREMNLSETVFLLPPARSDCVARARIFTPGTELPFAGHPTIGTAFVLATHGLVPAGATEFALEEASVRCRCAWKASRTTPISSGCGSSRPASKVRWPNLNAFSKLSVLKPKTAHP